MNYIKKKDSSIDYILSMEDKKLKDVIHMK